ncbi:Crp/Fnr family transcriptional regulator [Neptunicoccus cionae]|uniref:Crp/Fnr family transcriptional regulator n=1 Tax=Neptunicoccus cionae TaxID=2035344 RepID=UPI0015E103DD|nr:Crp/Fnr family transcriptional regulator [Amylibacter cionae]
MSEWMHLFEGAPLRDMARGAVVFRRDDPVQNMYLVRSGTVALERSTADGGFLTLHTATGGMALAEASLFSDKYHCDAVVRSDATVACVKRSDFLTSLGDSRAIALSLIETHAREVQVLRARIEILRLRRVADRLDAWLGFYGEPSKGEWITVAEQIGVSPPALYRELARRRGKRKSAP